MMGTLNIDRNFRCSVCSDVKDLKRSVIKDHIALEHKTGFARILAPKLPSWHALRKSPKAWAHINISLAGEKDIARCLICGDDQQLSGQFEQLLTGPGDPVPSDKVLSDFAKDHFNKHDLLDNF